MCDATPRLFVIDDDPSVRRALVRLLSAAGFAAQGFGSAEEFLRQQLPDGPACAVVDVHLPGLGGLDLQRALEEGGSGLPVVFITGHGDIPTTVRAMKGGAVDFLAKPFSDHDLLAAVTEALARGAAARQKAAVRAAVQQRAGRLTPRERQVMGLVVAGMLNKQVAHMLGVVEKTVKVHRARVMAKMEACSLPDLVRMAEQLGGPGGQ